MSDILIAQEVGTVVVIETAPAEIVEVVAVGPQGPVGDVNPQMPVILAATEAARDAALVSELAAATSQSVAATSAANAATSESNAATSAATATAQATASAGSATASAGSATASAGSAAAAQASATNAATSETNAANSATASANSATSSANSATAAQAAQAATESARDTTLATIGTAALKANNLSDLASIPTALINLGLNNVSNTSDANKPISTATQAALNLKENAANKGVANGYAGLDAAGKVPANQLPSYVDDVLEFANLVAFPATGEAGKIYVALDTNKTYRWSGSAYVEISASPGTTDALTEGATNLYFTTARVLAALSATGAGFPAGTRMLFAQTAAPSGWTKDTTHNDKALRVVSGSVGSGGTVAFSTVFSTSRDSSTVTPTGSVGNTTLSTNEMPGHNHVSQPTYRLAVPGNASQLHGDGISGGPAYDPWGHAPYAAMASIGSSYTGGGGAHTHSLAMNSHSHSTNLNVQYVDVIIATKD